MAARRSAPAGGSITTARRRELRATRSRRSNTASAALDAIHRRRAGADVTTVRRSFIREILKDLP
jgi:hypothetical protein